MAGVSQVVLPQVGGLGTLNRRTFRGSRLFDKKKARCA